MEISGARSGLSGLKYTWLNPYITTGSVLVNLSISKLTSLKKQFSRYSALLTMKLTLLYLLGVISAQRKRDRENSNKNRENNLIDVSNAYSNLDAFYGAGENRDSGTFGEYADFSLFTTTTVQPGFDYGDIFANYSDLYGGLTDGAFDFFASTSAQDLLRICLGSAQLIFSI